MIETIACDMIYDLIACKELHDLFVRAQCKIRMNELHALA